MLPLLLLLACRPDPGDPVYPDPTASGDDTGEDDAFYEGPDPYQEGEDRLSLGIFYESGASEVIPVDDVTRHYYIFEGTYTQTVDLIERIEGYESAVIVHGGGKWWGGGVTWDAAGDLSAWTTLHVSLLSGSEAFADLTIGMVGGGEEGAVAVTDVGYTADGAWHSLAIPLETLEAQGVDLSSVTQPLLLLGGAGAAGEELRIDNLYLTAD